ncbi:MAG: hypothetical protein RMI39_04150 [Thermoanaerobaculum sp.]|nr:hypothetical protein [Thermoanaerobaculum sp.]
MRALARLPEERFATVAALRFALSLAEEGQELPESSTLNLQSPVLGAGQPPTQASPGRRFSTTWRWTLPALATALLAGVLLWRPPGSREVVAPTGGEAPLTSPPPPTQPSPTPPTLEARVPSASPTPKRQPTQIPQTPLPPARLVTPPRPDRQLLIPTELTEMPGCAGITVSFILRIGGDGRLLAARPLQPAPPACLAKAEALLREVS